jgi:bifunctional DNA-binding transcriptional regulator/antitoxin component of YhaV-PrlF toxin-antitoxin module
MDKHIMWTHRRSGGVYQVLGIVPYKGADKLVDMGKVCVMNDMAGAVESVVPTHYTIPINYLRDEATVQVEEAAFLKEGDQLVVYRGGDAKLWVRPVKDFYDGRFQKLDDNLQPIPDPEPEEVAVKKTSTIGKSEAGISRRRSS